MRKDEIKNTGYKDLEDDKFYPVGVFRNVLAEKGLPSSMFAIMEWEKKGIIKSPRTSHNNWRSYTGTEIKENIKKLSKRD